MSNEKAESGKVAIVPLGAISQKIREREVEAKRLDAEADLLIEQAMKLRAEAKLLTTLYAELADSALEANPNGSGVPVKTAARLALEKFGQPQHYNDLYENAIAVGMNRGSVNGFKNMIREYKEDFKVDRGEVSLAQKPREDGEP